MTAYAAAPAPALTKADAYGSAEEHYDSIITTLRSELAQQMTQSQVEELLDTQGRE